MTIGSSHNHPADIAAALQNPASPPWAARFPNPPDLCFDYRRLLEQTAGIAHGGNPQHRICIIGAGVAGLVAARELLRCGFEQITLIEQSRRLGGRHLTVHVDGPQATASATPFEMGAMRMPFFNRTGEAPAQGRSLMAYYAGLYDLITSDFPNPGTPFVRSTGIYLREGQLAGEGEPRLLVWNNPDGNTPPPTDVLQAVHQKWKLFAERMARQVAAVFGSEEWPALWSAIVTRYQHVPFRELVRSAAITLWDPSKPGDFGGLGMSADESSIFYAIGIGDGSWGAFYDVCSLYPLRTAIFGFSSHLQLVHGRVDAKGIPLPAPFLGEQTVTDSKGVAFATPRYLGLAALDECLMFMPLGEGARSPYERLRQQPAGLITDSPVNGLTRLADGSIEVSYHWHQSDPLASRQVSQQFDSVIVTVPSWILETRIQVEGFTPAMLPQTTINAYKTAHWETSCKVYAPLKKSFLSGTQNIPQILITDSFVHDVYAYRYNDNYAYDCILLSYTWEDDATKLAAFSDAELVDKCVRELDRILLRCSNVGSRISPFIDTTNARVQRWVTDRNALGCAKLYRAGAYQDAVGLMSYNRDYSARSGLYFAGESFSVDAGWTEPAMRGAVDAVINLCANQGAAFNGGFDLARYPRYGVEP